MFPTAFEPDDCNGADGTGEPPIEVELTDADGRVVTMRANSVGNFYHRLAITPPYTARVLRGGAARVMRTPQRSADCNECHSERGRNQAPGRITPP